MGVCGKMSLLHIIEKGGCNVITGSCSFHPFRVSGVQYFLKKELMLLKFSVIRLVFMVQFLN